MRFSFFALFALASQFFMPSVAHADETKRVHIEASEPMRLEGRSYGSWIKVCDAPCDAKLRVVDVPSSRHGAREFATVRRAMIKDDELERALTIARRAAEVVRAIYATPFDVELKAPGDPVTRADRAANDVICALLAEAFPDDGILAEESVPADPAAVRAILARERVWMVDPIDGTAELVARSGEFAVMIGLVVAGKAELGVVVTPTKGEAFAGDAGARVAFREDASGRRTPLGVSHEQRPENVTLVLSRFHAADVVQAFAASIGIGRVVQRGSVGIKVCMVASAEADLYVHVGSRAKLWDAAGPEAILRAAGGTFTDWSGAPIDYRRADLRIANGIVASNGAVHASALEAIRRFVSRS